MYETNDVEWDKILDGLYEDEKVKKELQRHLVFSLLYGRQGYGKNFELSRQLRQQASWFGEITGNSNVVGAAKRDDRPTLPQKVCNYRKPRVAWYGVAQLTPERYMRNLSSAPGSHHNALWGKRFIAISEPTESDKFDQDSLKRLTGDEWVETRTSKFKPSTWEPKGTLYVL